jgi:hypothetical protein
MGAVVSAVRRLTAKTRLTTITRLTTTKHDEGCPWMTHHGSRELTRRARMGSRPASAVRSDTAGSAAPIALPLGVEQPATANRRRRGVTHQRVSSSAERGGGERKRRSDGRKPEARRSNEHRVLVDNSLVADRGERHLLRAERGALARRGRRGAESGSGPITLTRRGCTLLLDRVFEL